MRGLRNAELLEIWERGFSQAPPVRSLALLAAACPDDNPERLWALSIGQRDMRLMALRESLFGSQAEALASCPRCGRQVELRFSRADLHLDTALEPQQVTLDAGGRVLVLRAPNSRDLLAAGSREQLLQLCLSGADIDQLPSAILEEAEQKIAACDPMAEVRLGIACPDCRHEWNAVFDVVSFLWTELENWARHILNDVNALASAYGWSERDILALSPARRQLYLDLVQT